MKYHQIKGIKMMISIPTFSHCLATEPSSAIPIRRAISKPMRRHAQVAEKVGCHGNRER